MRKLTNRALFICFALMTSFCLIAPATALRSYAQEGGGSTLEGLIKDDSGPLLGATVIVKNTTRGTTTDMDGKFRLEGLQPGDVLQVTYVGYDPYEVTYTGQTTLDILMTTTANQLNAVVVTAMGIERQSKTLSYAAETVGGDDVADIKSVNMINALQGKAAGLQITPNSTGAGGSSKILFRGNKSINGSNQPLVVVDGVPLMMNITSDQVDSNWGAQRDGGDAMSTINPDDIASISLLKGASAAALYGAVAANFTTRSDADSWTRDDLKDEHDDLDDAKAILGTDARGAVVHMQATSAYTPQTALTNSARVDLCRNGGGDKLESHDEDRVIQRCTLPQDLPATGSVPIAACITALLTSGAAALWFARLRSIPKKH